MTTVLILIALLLPAAAAFAECKDGEILESSTNKIASAKIKDHVGNCSHHASRDLVHQEICRTAKSPEDCFQPAILDFLLIDAQEADPLSLSLHHRASNDALRAVLARKKTSTEECLSLEGLFPDTSKGKEFSSYGEKVMNAMLPTLEKECEKQGVSKKKCKTETRTEAGFNKYQFAAVIRYKREKKCPEKSIPPFFIRQVRPDAGGLSPSENLNKILRSGYQAKVATRDHAFVISNYREICVNGKAKLQYQTLDSLHGSKWSPAAIAEDWVDGENLLSSLHPQSSFLTIDIAKPAITQNPAAIDR